MPRYLTINLFCALLVVSSAAAQSQEPSGSAQGAAPAATQDSSADATKKPKRVWTNDDIPASRSAASTSPDPKSKPQPSGAKPNAGYAASVRKQLDKYQSQIADIDKQLTDLKNFKDGEPSTGASGVKLNTKYQREPIEVQMRALQDQKKDLLAKIDALLDEARKKGVESGDLR